MASGDEKKGPNLANRFKYRMAMRSNVEGIALEALGGDRECIKKLAGFGAVAMRREWDGDDHNAKTAWWLESILAEIAAGKSPNAAFGYDQTGRAAGRWKLKDFATIRKHYMLASTVEMLSTVIAGMSFADALAQVTKLWSVSEATATHAMASVPSSAKKLSRAQAKKIAVDVVSAFGAGGEHAGPDTIAQACRDFTRQG